MALCATCQAFDLQSWAREDFPWRGYPLLTSLRAASDGCPFCKLLVDCFPHARWPAVPDGWKQQADSGNAVVLPDLARRIFQYASEHSFLGAFLKFNLGWRWFHISLIRTGVVGPGRGLDVKRLMVSLDTEPEYRQIPPTEVQLEEHMSPRAGPYHAFELHVAADPDSPAAASGDVAGRYAETSTTSDEHIGLIHTWLRDCVSDHPECRQSLSGQRTLQVSEVPLPTRCIEIDDDLSLRLRHSSDLRGRYIALSHRWVAETGLCSTTRENYASRLKSLDAKCLPRHFRDTCLMAHRLGIKYVWIDSLCIIQNSPADWLQEASMMAAYYQNSYATIAVATPAAAGLFTDPGIESILGFAKLPYRDKSGIQRGSFYVYRIDLARQYRAVIQSELLTRGWIFQEWLLSRRIVCICPSGIFLQCQKSAPRSLSGDSVGFQSLSREFAQVAFKSTFRLDDASSLGDVFKSWEAIVEAYSGLQLTQAGEDRLIALSGVAQEVSQAIERFDSGQEAQAPAYLSGLWVADLPRQLLWEQIDGGTHERLASLPTWSWTSIKTRVKWASEVPHSRRIEKWFPAGTTTLQKVGMQLLGAMPMSTLDTATSSTETEDTIPPGGTYGNESRSVAIKIRSILLPITIHGAFSKETDIKFAADVTGHRPEFGRTNWRRVSSPTYADTVCGWASIEDPAFQSGEAVSGFALSISMTRVLLCGFGLGYLWPYHDVYNVLFLQRVDGTPYRFQRIGVGRLFGKEADRVFEAAQAEEVVLV